MSLASFALAAAVVLLTPGPTNTILAATGSVFGLRRSVLLPFAEAGGYAIAIALYLALARLVADIPAALPLLKCIAAAWLLFSGWKLWREPASAESAAVTKAYERVFVTTLLNPKAMLAGTILIPTLSPDRPVFALICFLALSLIAGAGWTALGAAMPKAARPHAYRGAALILSAFAAAALGSIFSV